MEYKTHPLFAIGDGTWKYFIGHIIGQSFASLYWWDRLLTENHFRSVLELGTGHGTLTTLFGLHLPDNVTTINNKDQRRPKILELHNRLGIKQIIYDVLNNPPSLFGSLHPMLLVCDNGDKEREFESYAPLLESGDWVAVHDCYVEFIPSKNHIMKIIKDSGLVPWQNQSDLDTDSTRMGVWRKK